MTTEQQKALMYMVTAMAAQLAIARFRHDRGIEKWDFISWHNETLTEQLRIVAAFGPEMTSAYISTYQKICEKPAEMM